MTKAFIVFGKDRIALLELKNFIQELGIIPVILEEEESFSDTIIEKFERVANQCQIAFVLMTPDDAIKSNNSSKRTKAARQNVLIELGWFFRHVSRKNVLILHKKDTEIPSNISGVLYLPFENSVLEVTEKIRSRLKALGFINKEQ